MDKITRDLKAEMDGFKAQIHLLEQRLKEQQEVIEQVRDNHNQILDLIEVSAVAAVKKKKKKNAEPAAVEKPEKISRKSPVRDRIIQLFLENGNQEMTLAQIAQAAEMNYHHVASLLSANLNGIPRRKLAPTNIFVRARHGHYKLANYYKSPNGN